MLQIFQLALLLDLLFCTKTFAYKIHDSCYTNKLSVTDLAQKTEKATAEAVNIVQNAVKRADYDKNPGTMMMDLFGDDNPAAFQFVKGK